MPLYTCARTASSCASSRTFITSDPLTAAYAPRDETRARRRPRPTQFDRARMPPAVWEDRLRPAVLSILREPLAPRDAHSVMSLYTAVYSYCTEVSAVEAPFSQAGANVRGGDLYECLRGELMAFFAAIGAQLVSVPDETLLAHFIRAWESCLRSGRLLDFVFRYLNAHLIEMWQESASSGVVVTTAASSGGGAHAGGSLRPASTSSGAATAAATAAAVAPAVSLPVRMLVIYAWREKVFSCVRDRVQRLVLAQIVGYRMGDTVDVSSVRAVVDALVSMGLHTLDLYRIVIEEPVLSHAARYYAMLAQEIASMNSSHAFAARVLELLVREQQLARLLLHIESEDKVRRCARAVHARGAHALKRGR